MGDHEGTNEKEEYHITRPSEPAATGLAGEFVGLAAVAPFHHKEDGHRNGNHPSVDGGRDVGRAIEEVGEHVPIVLKSMLDAVGTEEYPSHGCQEEGEEHLAQLAESGQQAACGNHIGVAAVAAQQDERQEKDGMIGSPGHEGPVGPMPETTDEEDDKGVQHHTPLGHTAAAHGDVYVVSEPCGQ